MPESGCIDQGHHANSAYNALTDTLSLQKRPELTNAA